MCESRDIVFFLNPSSLVFRAILKSFFLEISFASGVCKRQLRLCVDASGQPHKIDSVLVTCQSVFPFMSGKGLRGMIL